MIPIRLLRLHAGSRRLTTTVALLAAVAIAMHAIDPWLRGSGEFDRLLPILLTVGSASVVAACTASPFGEVERTACRLPAPRLILLCGVVAVAAVALILARPTAADLLVRNLFGLTGLALLTARVLGGPLAWTAPLAYAVFCGGAIDLGDESVWTWPTLPAGNSDALAAALVLFAAGMVIAIRHGARDEPRSPA
jgi:hypothetical protein